MLGQLQMGKIPHHQPEEMKSLERTILFFLFLMVTKSSQTALNLNLKPIVHSLLPQEHGQAEETYWKEASRQKRDVASNTFTPGEYVIDVELSFENASFLEPVKEYLKNLGFPILGQTTGRATDILSIEVTTVCSTSGNESHCSCESGYGWPPETCRTNLACPGYHRAALGRACSCLTRPPPEAPSCQRVSLKDVILKMSIKLNLGFQEDLWNSSSALYRSYKTDLEGAFTKGYRYLPGFKSAIVTGFRPGSVVVVYEVQTTTPTPEQLKKANDHVSRIINATYRMEPLSFQTAVDNETEFSITPDIIFEGDTVTMVCETEVQSTNVTWHRLDRLYVGFQNDSKHSVFTYLSNQTSISVFTITNISLSDASEYICTLTYDIFEYESRRKINVTAMEIVESEDMEVMCDNNPVSLSCCCGSNFNLSRFVWKQNGNINIPGITSSGSGCSNYTIKANSSQCPRGSSGALGTYTCEFSTDHGARSSRNIAVTFSSVANLIITPGPISISEGQSFSIKCISDVNHYDMVFWNTSAGVKIDRKFYTTTRYHDRVESVLTVGTASMEWNGTYQCIFKYKSTQSVAANEVTVHPLPLKQDIMLDPLEAVVPCNSSHIFKCCLVEGGDYRVTFQIGSLSFPAVRAAKGFRECYVYNYFARITTECPITTQVSCTIINRVNASIQSAPMTLNLIPGETVSCQDPNIGAGGPGKVIQKMCSFSNSSSSLEVGGTITYKCEGKEWKVERNNCISAPINSLLFKAKSLLKSPEQEEKLPTFLQNLSHNTVSGQNEISSSPSNLAAVVNILDLVSTVPTQVNQNTMALFLSTVNVLISKPTLSTWKVLNQQQVNESSRLLDSVERFSRVLHSAGTTIPPIKHANVQLKGIVTSADQATDYKESFVFQDSDLWGDVFIKKQQIESLKPNSSVVTVAYSTLRSILPQDGWPVDLVNGLVMTTTVSQSVTKSFKISMKFKKNKPSWWVPQCVFWNFNLSNHTGGWEQSGCAVDHVDRDHVFCTCNHLTSFSILMSPESPDPSSLLKILLDVISYIGLGFSILSLAACLIIEALVWKSVTKNRTSYMRHICIVNIAASLLVADSWFIVAAAIHDQRCPLNETACVAATFFIHFFYLSVFFWMLTLGLMLFYRLVFILHDTSKSIQKVIAFSLGYGCPLVISAITVGITQPRDVYTRKNACWLNWDDTKALLAFVIPALIIVVINLTITMVVISKILRPSIGDKPTKQEKNSLFQISKSIGVLTPLLGLTWGFGLATVFEGSSPAFHIIFTLLNAFQGLFILLFGCLWDKKVQESLLNKFSLSRWSSQHTKSTSLGSSTPVFSMSSPISRRFNNLFGKTATCPSTDGSLVSSS
ncbi:adhesion G protein-coupled receptor F5 isoform X2 [Ornithorhynchus anatinus]|uniref:Adhesion G protein-coupled receptor F5 n=1 Tax=Ornithorhynchus anatinus TaxID=9258 RepID=F6XQ28_ORNAN|nr:adhesion G protein-coupled receptor F5 isoform X2 [Ornithorhynchus anatinus]